MNPLPTVTATGGTICLGNSTNISANGSSNFSWSNSLGSGTLKSVKPTTNTTYTVTGTDINNCSNTANAMVNVNPLPKLIKLDGDTAPCLNQKGLSYNINETNSNYQYDWQIAGGIIQSNNKAPEIFVDWNDQSGNDSLTLKQTITQTGCYLIQNFKIKKKSTKAPDTTFIFRKKNSNLLICDKTPDTKYYDWGYTVNNINYVLQTDTLAYVLLPHQFNSSYVYWVETYNDTNCKTKSYYNLNTSIDLDNISNLKCKVYPNPSNGHFFIEMNDGFQSSMSYIIYNSLSEIIYQNSIKTLKTELLLNDIKPGIYLLLIEGNSFYSSYKLIITKN